MKTAELKYEVRRKDRDFNTLYEYLSKIYPHIYIPTCPEPKKDKIDDKSIAKRMRVLEIFINKCLMSEDLKICPVMVDFLKHQDYKTFSKNLKNSASKCSLPQSYKELYTPTGFHDLKAGKHMKEFSEKLPVYLNVYEATASKFHQLSRKLTEQFKDVSNTITELSDCAKNMCKIYRITDDAQFSKIYGDINITLRKWSTIINNVGNVCASNLALFHSYPNLHMNALKKLDANKVKFQGIFEKAALNLDRKKEKCFKSGDVSKWELSVEDLQRVRTLVTNKDEAYKAMFYKESQDLVVLRDNYMFFVNQCYNEFRRVNRYEMFGTLDNYQKFCERLKDCI